MINKFKNKFTTAVIRLSSLSYSLLWLATRHGVHLLLSNHTELSTIQVISIGICGAVFIFARRFNLKIK